MGSLKGSTAALKLLDERLERWGNNHKHQLLFQKTQVQFPAPIC